MDLDDLLQKTSRTFALAIPLLPEPTRRAVGLAYLLFRVADTFEDATKWPREKRIEALEAFVDLLESSPDVRAQRSRRLVAAWLEHPPVEHAGYLELLAETPALLAALEELSPAVAARVVHHAVRTTEGMASVVARADEHGNLQLASVQALKDYCYLVAGIVGELLTDVFLLDCPSLESERAALLAGMVSFGEGLQLINIIKDAGADAHDGRVYLPASVTQADLFALTRENLDEGLRYVQALQRGGAPRGFLAFTGLSLSLAYSALEALQAKGTGAKVSRAEVTHVFEALERELDSGQVLHLRTS